MSEHFGQLTETPRCEISSMTVCPVLSSCSVVIVTMHLFIVFPRSFEVWWNAPWTLSFPSGKGHANLEVIGKYLNDFLSNWDHTVFLDIRIGDLRAGPVCRKPQTVNRVDTSFRCWRNMCICSNLDGENKVDSWVATRLTRRGVSGKNRILWGDFPSIGWRMKPL